MSVPLIGALGWDEHGDFRGFGGGLRLGANFSDFPLRNYFIKAHNFIAVYGLGVMPSRDIIVGKQGFWFFASTPGTAGAITETHLRENPMTPDQLESRGMALDRFARHLKGLGIAFAFVVAPDKQSIYPEYLPEDFGPLATSPRRVQFVSYMRAHFGGAPYLLDLTEEISAHKMDGPLFYKKDSHWTSIAAEIGYRAILRFLISEGVVHEQENKPLPPPLWKTHSGDLVTNILGLDFITDGEWTPATTVLLCSAEGRQRPGQLVGGEPFSYHCPGALPRRALFYGDSFFFTGGFWNCFSHLFAMATLLGRNNPGIFDKISWQPKPQFIMVETVERSLADTLDAVAATPLPMLAAQP
jgi:hypothetical protein